MRWTVTLGSQEPWMCVGDDGTRICFEHEKEARDEAARLAAKGVTSQVWRLVAIAYSATVRWQEVAG